MSITLAIMLSALVICGVVLIISEFADLHERIDRHDKIILPCPARDEEGNMAGTFDLKELVSRNVDASRSQLKELKERIANLEQINADRPPLEEDMLKLAFQQAHLREEFTSFQEKKTLTEDYILKLERAITAPKPKPTIRKSRRVAGAKGRGNGNS